MIQVGAGGGLNNAIMQLRKICNHPYLFLNEWYMDDDLIRASGAYYTYYLSGIWSLWVMILDFI